MNYFFIGLVAVAIIAVGAWYLYGNNNSEMAIQLQDINSNNTTGGDSMTEKDDTTGGDAMMGQVREFDITGDNFKFSVTEMKVKKGDTVKINFTNANGFHDWKIDEFNAATKVLQSGQSETVQFVADKTGTFEYYCSVGQHRQMGMVGKLVVE